MRVKVYLFLFAVAIIGGGGYFFYRTTVSAHPTKDEVVADESSQAEKQGEGEAEPAVPVELHPASLGQATSYLSATANLRPLREVDVVSQTEALVLKVMAEEGDIVTTGQTLVQLDDRPLRIRRLSSQQKLAQAQLQLEKAKIRTEKAATQIGNSREELDRYERLFQEKLVSEREVAQLRYRVEELLHDERISSRETREFEHRVDELEAAIAEVDLLISQTLVQAPFAGLITDRKVEQGQMVRQLDQLYRLASFSPLFADVFLSEREARQVRGGQPVRIVLGADEAVAVLGRVARVSPVVDQSTGTVKITVEVTPQGRKLKPGAFVRVGIETDARSNAVLVPKRALIEEDGNHYLFVAESNQARRVVVKPGYENEGMSEILEGVTAGQQVVVAGQGALKDGSKIQVIAR